MPSRTYQLFRIAIIARRQITCTYHGLYREICPHVLGHAQGQEKALTFQFAGQSATRLPKGGEWRCLFLADVRHARLRAGPWKTKPHKPRTQLCVECVDLDVDG